jgi:hypothetical protein
MKGDTKMDLNGISQSLRPEDNPQYLMFWSNELGWVTIPDDDEDEA